MLAYLIAEPEPVGEPPLDAGAAVSTPPAQLAYEAAQQLNDEWWLARRRQTATAVPVVA